MIYYIKDYGAVGDGKTMNTDAIQRTIDECFKNGGGTVCLSDGVYMTGSITLKSNICLHIEANSTLLGSPHRSDYPEKTGLKHVISENLPRKRNASLIFAEECENISITGMGKIDCNGESFVQKKPEPYTGWAYDRIDAPTPPRAVFFTGCKNIKVEDITMVNQPSGWSYWIHDCDYVTFDKCKILADVNYPNNDGIHINSSRDVTVSNCNITCGDDCIVVRANNRSLKENKICERVTVTNCNLTSYANAIRIAWLNDGTIRNCCFSNITITDSNSGVCVHLPELNPDCNVIPDQGREATLIEDLSFDNIIMNGIYVSPIRFVIDDAPNVLCDKIQNIHFSNIRAYGLAFPWILGRSRNYIENISFSDCTFNKVSVNELPDEEHHGSLWGRSGKVGREMFEYTKNITFNNTIFNEV